MASDREINDGHYREIIARIEGLASHVSGARDDAREARDAAIKLTAQIASSDLPARLAELAGRVTQLQTEARSDLVNATDKQTRENRAHFEAHDARIKALEAFKTKVDGATGLVGWVAKHAPWIFAVFFAVLAGLGLKDKLPG